MHRPPRALAILIYGNPSSSAVSAISNKDFRETLVTVGHQVTQCDGQASCSKALSAGHFDVVLADPTDAAGLKASSTAGPAVVPVMLKASKDELEAAKASYGDAFDASRGSLRLLPVLSHAAKEKR